jgi:hypothetical protein
VFDSKRRLTGSNKNEKKVKAEEVVG